MKLTNNGNKAKGMMNDMRRDYFSEEAFGYDNSLLEEQQKRNDLSLNIKEVIALFKAGEKNLEQQIADIFSNVDELIAQSEAEAKDFEQKKKMVMQKVFLQEVRFNREDGTEYPEWKDVDFSNLFKSMPNQKYYHYLLEFNDVEPTEHNKHFSKLKDLSLKCPTDTEEQGKIADLFSSFDEVISLTKQEIDIWRKLKKCLQKKFAQY